MMSLRTMVFRLTEELLAGGPGSGWTAENGHVSHLTPSAKGAALQKMGYSLYTHDPNGQAQKDVWTHPAGTKVLVSKYNAPNQPNLRKFEVFKGDTNKVFSGHQFSKVQDAHAKATGQTPVANKPLAVLNTMTPAGHMSMVEKGFTYTGSNNFGHDIYTAPSGQTVIVGKDGYAVFQGPHDFEDSSKSSIANGKTADIQTPSGVSALKDALGGKPTGNALDKTATLVGVKTQLEGLGYKSSVAYGGVITMTNGSNAIAFEPGGTWSHYLSDGTKVTTGSSLAELKNYIANGGAKPAAAVPDKPATGYGKPTIGTAGQMSALKNGGFQYMGATKSPGGNPAELWVHPTTGMAVKMYNSTTGGKSMWWVQTNTGMSIGKGQYPTGLTQSVTKGMNYNSVVKPASTTVSPMPTKSLEPSIPAGNKNTALQQAGYKVTSTGFDSSGKKQDNWTHPSGSTATITDIGDQKSMFEVKDAKGFTTGVGKYTNDLNEAMSKAGVTPNSQTVSPVSSPKPSSPPDYGIKTDAAWRDKLQATVSGLWNKTSSNQYSSKPDTLYPMAAKEMGIPWNKVLEVKTKIHSWQGGKTANDGNPLGVWSQQIVNGSENAHPGMMLEYAHTQEYLKQNGMPNGGTFYRGYEGQEGSESGMQSQVTMLNLVAKNSPDQYHVSIKTYGAEGFSTSESVGANFSSSSYGAMVMKANVDPKYVMTGNGANPEMWAGYSSEQEWALAFPDSKMPISSFAGDKIQVKGAATSVHDKIFFNALAELKKWGWNYTVDGKNITIIPPREGKDWLRQLRSKGVTAAAVEDDVDNAADNIGPGTLAIMRSAIAERALGVESKAYKLAGYTSFQGLPISIENKKGSTRSGTQQDGSAWSVVMPFDYGYIKGTVGADGQPVDCFIGPVKDAKFAYVVHQTKFDKSGYDEDKVLLGFSSAARAEKAYRSAYNNVDLFYSMSVIPMHEFIRKVLATKGSKRPGKIHAEVA